MIKETGTRTFTGNFDVLLNHNNHDPKVKWEKNIVKKQLAAYLKGHERFGVIGRGKMGLEKFYFPVPYKFITQPAN